MLYPWRPCVLPPRYLAAAGHRPTLFEAGAALGGIWADVPENEVSAAFSLPKILDLLTAFP